MFVLVGRLFAHVGLQFYLALWLGDRLKQTPNREIEYACRVCCQQGQRLHVYPNKSLEQSLAPVRRVSIFSQAVEHVGERVALWSSVDMMCAPDVDDFRRATQCDH